MLIYSGFEAITTDPLGGGGGPVLENLIWTKDEVSITATFDEIPEATHYAIQEGNNENGEVMATHGAWTDANYFNTGVVNGRRWVKLTGLTADTFFYVRVGVADHNAWSD